MHLYARFFAIEKQYFIVNFPMEIIINEIDNNLWKLIFQLTQ